jgi:hypothetical protein
MKMSSAKNFDINQTNKQWQSVVATSASSAVCAAIIAISRFAPRVTRLTQTSTMAQR